MHEHHNHPIQIGSNHVLHQSAPSPIGSYVHTYFGVDRRRSNPVNLSGGDGAGGGKRNGNALLLHILPDNYYYWSRPCHRERQRPQPPSDLGVPPRHRRQSLIALETVSTDNANQRSIGRTGRSTSTSCKFRSISNNRRRRGRENRFVRQSESEGAREHVC